MKDWKDLYIRDACTDAVRNEIAGMRMSVIADMAKETGPTDLTPFCLIALAAVNAYIDEMEKSVN